jgi:hypothetical protein
MRPRSAVKHLGGHTQTLLGEFKDREHLLPLHARKPPQEVVHTGSVFKILEKSLYWHTGAFEQPHTGDFPRNALNSRTLVPIEHCCSIAVLVLEEQGPEPESAPSHGPLAYTLEPKSSAVLTDPFASVFDTTDFKDKRRMCIDQF